MSARPPRVARWIAAALLPASEREYLVGDLDELYERDIAAHGQSRARLRYWRQTLLLARHRVARPYASTTTARTLDMSRIFHDVIVGARTAWRLRTYSAITILTLALAIGANTLLFSIANPIAVRALPIAKSEEVGWIQTINHVRGIDRGQVSIPDFIEFRDRARSFATLAGYVVDGATLSGHQQDPERVSVLRGTVNLTDVWGLKPVVGRLFQQGDDDAGRPIAAVLSTRYWRERFQQDKNVLGRQFLLNNKPLVVVGVMTPEIELGNLSLIDFWTAMPLDAAAPRDVRTLRVMGRLTPGVPLDAANAEVRGIAAQQAAAHPDSHKDWEARVVSTRAAAGGSNTWIVLLLLSIVVAFVLLIACANLANLVMARLTAGRIDLAVRQALGASRWQLVRPLLVESLILSVTGGLFGVAIAYAGLRIVNAVAYEAYFKSIGIDANVLLFAAGISILTPMLFCLWPALSAGRAATASTLRDSRSSGGQAVKIRRNVLVACQVALALSLLVVSTLAVRSMMYLRAIELGIDVKRMAMFRYELPEDRYADADARARFAETLSAELSRIGGVGSAAIASHLPVFDGDIARQVEGLAQADGQNDQPLVSWYSVTPGFFRTAGVPLLSGRAFNDADRAGTEPVVILNDLAATRYFGSAGNAIGHRVVLAGRGEEKRAVTVVGIARDTRAPSITATSPQAYVPFSQWPTASVVALVRADDPELRLGDVRSMMRRVDAAIPITDLRTVQDKQDDEMSSDAILNGLFISFAALALVLAAGGLYGVISYSVGQRTREIGVRMALGAKPAGISRMVLFEGLKVIAAGIAGGLLLGLAIARLAVPVLQGVTPTDPPTFLIVTLTVLAVAVASILAPALRAMRMDPARTLRAD